jgi:3-oxoacyl-[acyl-carrier-protein] synthase II
MISALGATSEETFVRLMRGERGIGAVSLFDASAQRAKIAAEVRGLTLPEDGRAWSRTAALAHRAASEAVRHAGLDVRASRVGLVVGATTGGMFETEALLARLYAEPGARDALAQMLSHPLTSTSDRLAETLGPFARVRTLCSACSSGANALIVGALWLLAGEVDAVVAGGADGLCRLTFTGFNALGALDSEPCKPFDKNRRGLTLGEGAGFVVMERAESARRRGARPIAELAGWASGAEAHHITNPDPSGELVASLVARAVSMASLDGAHVDYVNAHGTGTPLNDPIEAAALARALGPSAAKIPVSSSKGQIGHTLGAAGAIEAVITALAVHRNEVPPTVGLADPDPACALTHVMHVGRSHEVRAAVSSSFGFGGMDAALVLTKPELGPPIRRARRAVAITGAAALTPAGMRDAADAHSLLDAKRPDAESIEARVVDGVLDSARARRLDRPARLGAIVVGRALESAATKDAGLVLGSAFGNVDASAAFMHRLFEKGPRFASPAEFPNLVPSSPVGHVSIYFALRGPVFGVADLGTSGESAFLQAAQLVASGEATRVVAGAVEEKSGIVERVLAALFDGGGEGARGEGAAAMVVEHEEAARARGARLLARVVATAEWRGAGAALDGIGAPRDVSRAVVVAARAPAIEALVGGSAWSGCARLACSGAGAHEGIGGVAIVAAISAVASGSFDEALVIGVSRGRGAAVVLARGD